MGEVRESFPRTTSAWARLVRKWHLFWAYRHAFKAAEHLDALGAAHAAHHQRNTLLLTFPEPAAPAHD